MVALVGDARVVVLLGACEHVLLLHIRSPAAYLGIEREQEAGTRLTKVAGEAHDLVGVAGEVGENGLIAPCVDCELLATVFEDRGTVGEVAGECGGMVDFVTKRVAVRLLDRCYMIAIEIENYRWYG